MPDEIRIGGLRIWAADKHLFIQTPDGRIAKIPPTDAGEIGRWLNERAAHDDHAPIVLDLSKWTIHN